MPEILTESFCERCGTRYTFESAAPTKVKRLGRIKTISKGLKNYVMSDETSLDEALAAARSDDERELTAQQLDAFHSTFNFCMNCRQYTCANCWNQPEGMCLTCAPHLGHEIMPAPFPDLDQVLSLEQIRIDADAWPTMDLPVEETPAAVAEPLEVVAAEIAQVEAEPPQIVAQDFPVVELAPAEAEPAEIVAQEPLVADEPMVADERVIADERVVADEPVAARYLDIDEREIAERLARLSDAPLIPAAARAEAAQEHQADFETEIAAAHTDVVADVPEDVEAPSEAVDAASTVDARAAAAAAQTAALLAKFRPGQSIDAELEAYEAATAEAEPVAAEVQPEPEVATAPEPVAAAPEPEPVAAVAPEPEPVAAVAPEPEPEPVAAVAAEPEPVAAEPEPVAAVAPEPEPAPVAPEPEPAPVAAEPEPVAAVVPEPEPVAAVVAEPEPVAAVVAEPEPVAAVAPEPEHVAAVAPEPEPVAAEPEPEPVAASAAPEPEHVRSDRVVQPTWQIVAPDVAVPATNGHPPAEPALPAAATAAPATAEPEWPSSPEWPVAPPNLSMLADRATALSAATAALWAASARDVVAQPPGAPPAGVQPCANCGLSLSATARFCRRCGSRQGA